MGTILPLTDKINISKKSLQLRLKLDLLIEREKKYRSRGSCIIIIYHRWGR